MHKTTQNLKPQRSQSRKLIPTVSHAHLPAHQSTTKPKKSQKINQGGMSHNHEPNKKIPSLIN